MQHQASSRVADGREQGSCRARIASITTAVRKSKRSACHCERRNNCRRDSTTTVLRQTQKRPYSPAAHPEKTHQQILHVLHRRAPRSLQTRCCHSCADAFLCGGCQREQLSYFAHRLHFRRRFIVSKIICNRRRLQQQPRKRIQRYTPQLRHVPASTVCALAPASCIDVDLVLFTEIFEPSCRQWRKVHGQIQASELD